LGSLNFSHVYFAERILFYKLCHLVQVRVGRKVLCNYAVTLYVFFWVLFN
jgi:hypothetical protein